MYRRFNKNYNYKNRGWRNSNKNYWRNYRYNSNYNSNFAKRNKLVIRRGMGPVIRQMIMDNDVSNRREINRLNNNIREVKNKINSVKKEINNTNAFSVNRTNLVGKNKNKNKKELRTDKLATPMEMVLRGQYMPLFKLEERCATTYTYSKFVITFATAYPNVKMLLFPYSVNFKDSLFDLQEPVMAGGARCDKYHNIGILRSGNNANLGEAFCTAASGIGGNWKLLGTTYKLMNVTPKMNQGGSITITKLVDNDIAPMFGYHTASLTNGEAITWLEDYVNGDYSQVQPKNNFQPSSEIYIDEYNTSSGNNIFQGMNEYLGTRYLDVENGFYAKYPNDSVGNNIKYLVEISIPASNGQTYVLEVWNVFHVIPEPDSGLSSLAKYYKNWYSRKVLDEIKNAVPMHQKE